MLSANNINEENARSNSRQALAEGGHDRHGVPQIRTLANSKSMSSDRRRNRQSGRDIALLNSVLSQNTLRTLQLHEGNRP
jgi:hypothetical protein